MCHFCYFYPALTNNTNGMATFLSIHQCHLSARIYSTYMLELIEKGENLQNRRSMIITVVTHTHENPNHSAINILYFNSNKLFKLITPNFNTGTSTNQSVK